MPLHCLEQMIHVQLLGGSWKLRGAELPIEDQSPPDWHGLSPQGKEWCSRTSSIQAKHMWYNGKRKHKMQEKLRAVSGLAALPRPAPVPGRAEQRCGDTLPLQWPNMVAKGKNRMTFPREAETPSPTEIKTQSGPAGASN